MKILAIVGSLRKESLNLQLAQAAQAYLAQAHPTVEFTFLDWAGVPLLNQDEEYPAPTAVAQVRQAVKAADGLWLFTPEYNHFFPGTVKNLIDWLSRPPSAEETQVLAHKPIALSGITPGTSGTALAQDHLVTLLSLLNARIMNAPRLTIPSALAQMQNGTLALQASQPYLEKQAEAFLPFITSRAPAPQVEPTT
ncbi:MAG: NADPH-dependent FMN reductase [Raoultibacter sp.]